MTEPPDTTEAVAKALDVEGVLRHPLTRVLIPRVAHEAIKAHREELQRQGWVECKTVRLHADVYDMGVRDLISNLQSLGLPIEVVD